MSNQIKMATSASVKPERIPGLTQELERVLIREGRLWTEQVADYIGMDRKASWGNEVRLPASGDREAVSVRRLKPEGSKPWPEDVAAVFGFAMARYTRLPETAAVAGYTASVLGGSFTFRSTRTYEPNRNLIAAVSNVWGAATVSTFAYTNDALGRRTQRVDTAQGLPVTNVFAYNQRSEVTNAVMGDADYSYEFDDIGNRERAAADAALTVYAANALNQYASVTAAGQDVPVAYDLDGNMTSYGPWTYTWDAENRMSSACSNGVLLVTNVYDHMSRRISKQVYVWDAQASAYSLQSTSSFLWDGWNVIREIVGGAGSAFTNYYTWGLDLSGTLQGAGGVGGLLAVTRVGPESQQPQVFYPCYDANGNVTAYLDAQGTAVAGFEYDAFGNTVSETVAAGLHLSFRFSTKYWDAETGRYYYGYRFYHPELGRWISRDPVGETGFSMMAKRPRRLRDDNNLYGSCGNSMVRNTDYLGLYFGGAGLSRVCCMNNNGRVYQVVSATPSTPCCNTGDKETDSSLCGCEKCARSVDVEYAKTVGAHFPGASNDGPGDAVRHCVWSCQISAKCGKVCSIIATFGHEIVENRGGEHMDYYNNVLGARMTGDCVSGWIDKLYNNEFHIDNPEQLPSREGVESKLRDGGYLE